ncbi:MAG: zf-HC2 domain-containing protein [Candidatus Omnitrophota bacterium]
MDCNRIQELLKTDYLDGEVSAALGKTVLAHLEKCHACRELEKSLRQEAVGPFKAVREIKPPAFVWERIREAAVLEKAKPPEGFWVDLKERLSAVFLMRRPVFAVATVAVLIVAAVVLTRGPFPARNMAGNYLEEQVEFLADLGNGEATSGDDALYVNLGTGIEEYFL